MGRTSPSPTARHSADPKVNWNDTGELTVIVSFDADNQASVSFPNTAFPAGAYPASVADAKRGMVLKTGDRLVYQSVSPDVVDTLTLDGLSSGHPAAVWQRFRTDEESPRSIALQGRCTHS